LQKTNLATDLKSMASITSTNLCPYELRNEMDI